MTSSNKNDIIINPKTFMNKKINQFVSWIVTKTEKLNDSDIITTFKINKPRKISKLDTNKHALTDASTEYLFLLK